FNEGGEVIVDNNGIMVKNSNKVTLLLTSATSFNGRFNSPGFEGKTMKVLLWLRWKVQSKNPI
ncbi:MAG: hypothetical protein R6W89_02545, partial [Candidatus Hydrogenedentota bacterium]